MEAISSSGSSIGDGNKDMEVLLEAFGTAFSLEAIAAAYSQASRNVDLAGVILYESQGNTCPQTDESIGELDVASTLSSSELSSEDAPQNPCTTEGDVTGLVTKDTVSGVPAGNYVRPTLSASVSSRSLDSNESFSGTGSSSSTGKDKDSMHEDMEEFLFKMLGDGFQLDMKVIHEVLGLCGYDLEKSMETLVDLSASTLGKSDDVVSRTAERSGEYYLKVPEKSQLTDPSPRSMIKHAKESHKKNKDRSDAEKEILGALFTAPERVVERPTQTNLQPRVRRSRAYGRPVIEPMKETIINETFVAVKSLGAAQEDEEDDNSFLVLRRAVKEYWATMKEYYKAAAEAYTKGDQVRANKLMKEGQFYNRKAREADEKSAQRLLETSDEEMLLDFSTLELKEAIKLLKLHISNLAGIPTIRFLKLTVENNNGESKRGSLKRLVQKLLERESIEWTEANSGKMIVIRLDEINPRTLSFAKKFTPI